VLQWCYCNTATIGVQALVCNTETRLTVGSSGRRAGAA
jgi:hypothetical protein